MSQLDQWEALIRSQIGTVEAPPGSNDTKYGVWYGWNGVPWCEIFGDWAYAQVGVQLPFRSAGVVDTYDRAKALGLLIPSTQAVRGDGLLRGWQGIPREAPSFDPDETHFQEVLGVRGSALDLAGGNQNDPSGGIVSYDTATAGESTILGAVRWSQFFTNEVKQPVTPSKTTPAKLSPSHPNPRPMLYQGMPDIGQLHAWCRRYQNSLSHKGYPTIAQDGLFGPATDAATRDFQKNNGLVVDGVVGMKTYKAAGLA